MIQWNNAALQAVRDVNPGPTVASRALAIMHMAAQAVLSFRHGDGSNQLSGYADTSNYQPVNTPDQIIDPLRWQPLRVNGKVQKYLTPHWGTVAPFALSSGSQFRPAGGPIMSTCDPAYKSQVDIILDYSANLSDTTKTIADYWANGPHSETPPGHWMIFSQFSSAQSVAAGTRTIPTTT